MQAANNTTDAISTSASTALLPPSPAGACDRAAPLAIAAIIKLTEPHTRTRP